MASIVKKESISEWVGLVVSRVHENDLLPAARGEIMWRALPVQLVRFPVDDLSSIAILSWRWDFDEQTKYSRNLLCAIRRHAKQSGVQFLFIDVISIDQSLDENKLLEQVVAFSTLYRTKYPSHCCLRSDWRRFYQDHAATVDPVRGTGRSE
jgi:hypothetical protein